MSRSTRSTAATPAKSRTSPSARMAVSLVCMVASSATKPAKEWPLLEKGVMPGKTTAVPVIHRAGGAGSGARSRGPVDVLDDLDVVAVGVVDERDDDRPAVEALRRHRRRVARGDDPVMGGLAVIDVHVELPQGKAVVYRLATVVPLGQLQAAAAAVGGEDDLVHIVDLGPALDLEPHELGVELLGALDVAHVDAVLPDGGWHPPVAPSSGHAHG